MKRLKLLPSILMLVLCVGVLAVGIYAAAPISHTIGGTITVSASGLKVQIVAKVDNSDGDFTNDASIGSLTTNKSGTLELTNPITFDCEGLSAGDEAKVPTKMVYLEVTNLSSKKIGVYFSNTTQTTTVAKTLGLNGTSTSGNVENAVMANFSSYTGVEAEGTVKMYMNLSLNKIGFEAVSINLTDYIRFNVEMFDETKDNETSAIYFVNNSNKSVTASLNVQNAKDSITQTQANVTNLAWDINNLEFSTEAYSNGELRLQAVNAKVAVTNPAGGSAIRVSVIERGQPQTEVKVITIGNDYIPEGTTKEVSIQFQAIYDREEGPVTTAPTIEGTSFEVRIEESDQASELVIHKDATKMGGRGLEYYIEFGNNPYYNAEEALEAGESYEHRDKLRWYIWAEDNGQGVPTVLTTTPTAGNGKTYYFISEYTLDISKAEEYLNIPFQQEYLYEVDGKVSTYENFYQDSISDYAGSTLREYLTGLSVRSTCYDAYYDDEGADWGMPNGLYTNFYKAFRFTEGDNAVILNKIQGRKLGGKETVGSLYNDMGGVMETGMEIDTSCDFPSGDRPFAENDEDLFWAMSCKEYYNFLRTPSAASYYLSKGTENSSSAWWLRSPEAGGSYRGWKVLVDGSSNCRSSVSSGGGIRPAFKLAV